MSDKKIRYLNTVRDVAQKFGVTEHTVRVWIDEGSLEAERIRVPGSEVPADQAQTKLYITERAVVEKGIAFYKIGQKK